MAVSNRWMHFILFVCVLVEVLELELLDSVWHHPGALTHASVPAGERPPYGLVLYYSFISQLTVGYGDMAPAHRLTRAVSILQALFGVMYIAILISWFVSLLAASHLNRKP